MANKLILKIAISLYTNAIQKNWRIKLRCSFPDTGERFVSWCLGDTHESCHIQVPSIPKVKFSTCCFSGWDRISVTSFLRKTSLNLWEIRQWSMFASILVTYQDNFRWIAPFDIWVEPGWSAWKIETEPWLRIQHRIPLPNMVFGAANSGCVSHGSFICFSGQWADLLWKQSR